MDLGLKNKAALVTAASKGMGKACALGLAAEGARVLMCARTARDIEAAAEEVRGRTGVEVVAMVADVTRAADIAALGARAREAFGGVDILIANSGGPPRADFEQTTDEQWHAAFDVSVLSVVRLIREVLPTMRARGWGRILTIQSVSVRQPVEGLVLSNGVRPGVAGLVKTLSEELGRDGITINVLCPGKIMTDRFLGGVARSGLPAEEYVRRAAVDVPLQRIGTPEEFASVAVFLASERASYVTGTALQIDGGLVRANV
jgi:3-oxoacyl-[acyl-carrier protein] reductase